MEAFFFVYFSRDSPDSEHRKLINSINKIRSTNFRFSSVGLVGFGSQTISNSLPPKASSKLAGEKENKTTLSK